MTHRQCGGLIFALPPKFSLIVGVNSFKHTMTKDLVDRLRNAYQCCKDCGNKYGVYSVGCSSSRIGKCNVCDVETWVTDTRDYAYLITGIRRVEAARKSAG